MTPPLTMALTMAALAAIALGAVIIRRLGTIHVLVNSNLTRVKADLAAAREEIGKLREQLGEVKQEVPETRNADPETDA